MDSNAHDGDKAKGAIALDAFPGLGKTTAVLAFAKQFHLREIAEHGPVTAAGHERWPVCRVRGRYKTTSLEWIAFAKCAVKPEPNLSGNLQTSESIAVCTSPPWTIR